LLRTRQRTFLQRVSACDDRTTIAPVSIWIPKRHSKNSTPNAGKARITWTARDQPRLSAALVSHFINQSTGVSHAAVGLDFFVVSVIAGFFGFSGVSAATAGVAKILFYIAIVIFIIFLVVALMGGAMVL
jgi:uncharacterized membrane protein YtjA (UPF0391 family)